jgi:hypothetical protein
MLKESCVEFIPEEEAQFGGETGPTSFQAELFGPRPEHPALRQTTFQRNLLAHGRTIRRSPKLSACSPALPGLAPDHPA